ncbi:MAG: phosphatase PAP2 family protein [Bacillota bacterium]|jgi:hypothetical protein
MNALFGGWRDIATVLWREHRWAFLIVCLSAASLRVLDHTVAPGLVGPLDGWWTGVFLVELVPVVVVPVLVWQRLVLRRPWGVMTSAGPAAPVRLLGLALTLLLTRSAVINAVSWKAGLPLLHPFAFDALLAGLDHALHHTDPWRLLRFLTRPRALRLVDAFYAAWYIAFFLVVVAWGWARPSAQRRRFLTAMMLTWIVGSVLSVLVASAGPVYYNRVTGEPGPYLELIRRLHALPLAATRLQAQLWDAYVHPGVTFAKGIAAFPSLHVAMPALYAMSTPPRWHLTRWLWWGFTAVTLFASVVLGWHYAVDGYAGILLAAGCWWVTGHLAHSSPLVKPAAMAVPIRARAG